MPFQICLMILICLILGFSGCMKAVAPKPAEPPVAPSAAPPVVEFKAPYDSEIPEEYVDLLRRVPVPAGEAVPLIFLAVAERFAAHGEEEMALYFLGRSADGFNREKNASGEAAAWSRKVVLLSDSGREAEANELIRWGRETWKTPPLRAFWGYLDGHRALLQGDFPRAIAALNRSLQDNEAFRGDDHLLKLRRDTELDAGIAAILAGCVPGLLTPYGLTGTPVSGAGAAAGVDRLREALALNQELYQTKTAPLLPAADFQKLEAEAHNFLGLWSGMGGGWCRGVPASRPCGESVSEGRFPGRGDPQPAVSRRTRPPGGIRSRRPAGG